MYYPQNHQSLIEKTDNALREHFRRSQELMKRTKGRRSALALRDPCRVPFASVAPKKASNAQCKQSDDVRRGRRCSGRPTSLRRAVGVGAGVQLGVPSVQSDYRAGTDFREYLQREKESFVF